MVKHHGKITVVIPYYKGKKYIHQTVDSVVSQPYKNIEILLINDGSPDDGDEVCRALAAQYPCIRYFKKENEGIGATRNFGIQHATGDYIEFLDQDDVWVKDFLDDSTVEAIFSGGDVVCFSLYNCNHDFSRGWCDFVQNKVITGGGVKASTKVWKHHSSMFFRRSMILEHDIRAPRTRHEDEIFRHKCLYVSQKVTLIDKLMFLYRNNPASETHRRQSVESLYGPILGSWKELIQWHEDKHPEDLEAEISYKTLFCVYAIEGIEALCAAHYKMKDIEQIANEQLYLNDVRGYLPSIKDTYLRQRIESYIGHPKKFSRRHRIRGYMQDCGKLLLKLRFIKSYYYKKKYPVDLKPLGLLYCGNKAE